VSSLAGPRGPRTQLSEARNYLERAVRFDPTNSVAHYNLGRVYEDLLQEDRAATEYQIAFDSGLDLAGNNLGHLYLLRGEYNRAAFVLQQSSVLAEQAVNKADSELRYAGLKNLGWARWGQRRYGDARALLEEAVRVNPERAEAHCLLAKTLGALHDQGAGDQWHSCLGLTWQDLRNPSQDIWVGEARAFLEGTTNEKTQ
jgi:Tfp pilus assembly protein PilF